MFKQAFVCILPVLMLISMFSDLSDSAPSEQSQQQAVSIDQGFKVEFSKEALQLVPKDQLRSVKLKQIISEAEMILEKSRLEEFSLRFDEVFEISLGDVDLAKTLVSEKDGIVTFAAVGVYYSESLLERLRKLVYHLEVYVGQEGEVSLYDLFLLLPFLKMGTHGNNLAVYMPERSVSGPLGSLLVKEKIIVDFHSTDRIRLNGVHLQQGESWFPVLYLTDGQGVPGIVFEGEKGEEVTMDWSSVAINRS